MLHRYQTQTPCQTVRLSHPTLSHPSAVLAAAAANMSAVAPPAGLLGKLLASYRSADPLTIYIATTAAGIAWVVGAS